VGEAARIILAATVGCETFYDDGAAGPRSPECRIASLWALLLPGLLADAGDRAQLRMETGPGPAASADGRGKRAQGRS
jgi:hypothetical protein